MTGAPTMSGACHDGRMRAGRLPRAKLGVMLGR
jgi:hypothetical protein